jgi:hypothetical protein
LHRGVECAREDPLKPALMPLSFRAGGLYGELAEMQFGMVESGAP